MTSSLETQRIRILRLLDPRLVSISSDLTHVDWIVEELLQSRWMDEKGRCHQLVQQVFAESSELEGLFQLANELINICHGVPVCLDHEVWHRLTPDLDTDLLLAARIAEERLPPGPISNWPSVLAAPFFQLESLLNRCLVDSHVHLSGALPSSFYWVALMSGFTILERFQSWGFNPRVWPQLLQEASDRRLRLAGSLLNIPKPKLVFPSYPDPDIPPEPFVDYILHAMFPDPKERMYHNPVVGERHLLLHALAKYRRGLLSQDDEAEFLGYLKIRNSFIRHLDFREGPRGLDRYIENHRLRDPFDPAQRRIWRARIAFERFRMRHALRFQFSDPTDAPWARDFGRPHEGLPDSPWRAPRQVEIRVSPQVGFLHQALIRGQLLGFKDFAELDHDAPLLRLGLIFHLIRRNKVVDHLFAAQSLFCLLKEQPNLRPFVVGVDLAGSEKGASPRDFALFFREIQRLDASQNLNPGQPPIRLKRTLHAGEDFDDQWTGLRYMDDALGLIELQPGERLGHGTALFFSPGDWYGNRHRVHKRHCDHLLDLVWGLYRVKQNDPELPFDVHLAAELRETLMAFCPDINLKALKGVLKDYHRCPQDVQQYKVFLQEGQLYTLLTRRTIKQGEELVSVKVTPEYVGWVSALRERVRRRISKAELVLEACPTSNMLISNLGAYKDLPYLNLNRTGLVDEATHTYPVLMTLNTDNPGNMGTTIANEYRLMGQALRNQHRTMQETLAWLEGVRQTSVAATFIPPWNPPTKAELKELLAKILT